MIIDILVGFLITLVSFILGYAVAGGFQSPEVKEITRNIKNTLPHRVGVIKSPTPQQVNERYDPMKPAKDEMRRVLKEIPELNG